MRSPPSLWGISDLFFLKVARVLESFEAMEEERGHSLIVQQEGNTDFCTIWPFRVERVLAVAFEVAGKLVAGVCDWHFGCTLSIFREYEAIGSRDQSKLYYAIDGQ